MKNKGEKQVVVIDKESLDNFKYLSLGLENTENFKIDVADILDISCAAYRYVGSGKYGDCYHTDCGYIVISSRARELLSDFYSGEYAERASEEEKENCKLYKRMAMCDDMVSFSLRDKSDRWMHIYVPYDALEEAVHRTEIDYANCPSFRIRENGDMEIKFGKLSENPIIPRNNYPDLVDDWKEVLGGFNPKKLNLRVCSRRIMEFEYEREITLYCTILNKKQKGRDVSIWFTDCDKIYSLINGKIKKAKAVMSRLCDGKIYFGITDYFWVTCKTCRIMDDL